MSENKQEQRYIPKTHNSSVGFESRHINLKDFKARESAKKHMKHKPYCNDFK